VELAKVNIEEERMLDSGHYELAEARKRAARIESMFVNQSNVLPLPELKEPVSKSFRFVITKIKYQDE
jgi:hypothetical protein